MGKAVIKAADSAGLNIVPLSFGSAEETGQTVQVSGKDILLHGAADRENVLASVFDQHPNLVVVDYTVPSAVNGNYYGTYNLKGKESISWNLMFLCVCVWGGVCGKGRLDLLSYNRVSKVTILHCLQYEIYIIKHVKFNQFVLFN